MSGLDPSIIEHHIDTWPDVSPVHQNQRPLCPSKFMAIKAKIDKLCSVGFIYPIVYTSWVSNPVLVHKKRALFMSTQTCTISIIDECAIHEALSFMDGLSGYNQIQIHLADQYKTTFTTPWGTFSYRVIPFGLKNVGATFQWAMTYVFHDISHIIISYLDDLTSRSKMRTHHLDDLHIIFQRCHQYNIRLNSLKCVFCITVRHLLGLILSQHSITVDALKVQAIIEISPPRNLCQL
jgi:hypothetical protein